MRVLLSTVSPAYYMAPPLLGEEQIVCGPDWVDARDADGRWISLKTPLGQYDLGTVLAKLSPAQRPDVVVCLVDSSWRNQPRGLATIKCPRVLLIADTHHLSHPLIGMLRYMTSEPFTRTVILYDRHHAPIFHAAGIRNLFWLPGLTFPHRDAAVHAARRECSRDNHIAFVGQCGALHPQRARLMKMLQQSGVPLRAMRLGQVEGLAAYGRAAIGFNASLNGDLNLRVFEIIASGAMLLTDRLSHAAGLDLLLREGREVLSYGNPGELVEFAIHALANPELSARIGAAGARWFDDNFSDARRREAFRSVAIDGKPADAFPLAESLSGRKYFDGAVAPLVGAVQGYEVLQELHRRCVRLRVAIQGEAVDNLARLCGTLPRIELVTDARDGELDIVIMDRIESNLPPPHTSRIWFWNATVAERPLIEPQLTEAGFIREEGSAAWFRRAECVTAPLRDAEPGMPISSVASVESV